MKQFDTNALTSTTTTTTTTVTTTTSTTSSSAVSLHEDEKKQVFQKKKKYISQEEKFSTVEMRDYKIDTQHFDEQETSHFDRINFAAGIANINHYWRNMHYDCFISEYKYNIERATHDTVECLDFIKAKIRSIQSYAELLTNYMKPKAPDLAHILMNLVLREIEQTEYYEIELKVVPAHLAGLDAKEVKIAKNQGVLLLGGDIGQVWQEEHPLIDNYPICFAYGNYTLNAFTLSAEEREYLHQNFEELKQNLGEIEFKKLQDYVRLPKTQEKILKAQTELQTQGISFTEKDFTLILMAVKFSGIINMPLGDNEVFIRREIQTLLLHNQPELATIPVPFICEHSKSEINISPLMLVLLANRFDLADLLLPITQGASQLLKKDQLVTPSYSATVPYLTAVQHNIDMLIFLAKRDTNFEHECLLYNGARILSMFTLAAINMFKFNFSIENCDYEDCSDIQGVILFKPTRDSFKLYYFFQDADQKIKRKRLDRYTPQENQKILKYFQTYVHSPFVNGKLIKIMEKLKIKTDNFNFLSNIAEKLLLLWEYKLLPKEFINYFSFIEFMKYNSFPNESVVFELLQLGMPVDIIEDVFSYFHIDCNKLIKSDSIKKGITQEFIQSIPNFLDETILSKPIVVGKHSLFMMMLFKNPVLLQKLNALMKITSSQTQLDLEIPSSVFVEHDFKLSARDAKQVKQFHLTPMGASIVARDLDIFKLLFIESSGLIHADNCGFLDDKMISALELAAFFGCFGICQWICETNDKKNTLPRSGGFPASRDKLAWNYAKSGLPILNVLSKSSMEQQMKRRKEQFNVISFFVSRIQTHGNKPGEFKIADSADEISLLANLLKTTPKLLRMTFPNDIINILLEYAMALPNDQFEPKRHSL